jgi:hypothetical protein
LGGINHFYSPYSHNQCQVPVGTNHNIKGRKSFRKEEVRNRIIGFTSLLETVFKLEDYGMKEWTTIEFKLSMSDHQ